MWLAEQEEERRRVAQQEHDRLEAIRRERAVREAARVDRAREAAHAEHHPDPDDDPVGGLEGSVPKSAAEIRALLESVGLKLDVPEKSPSESQALIAEVTDEFRDFLIMKNEQYGDSAIDPVRVFSKASPEEQLKVRMDDKLSRLVRGDDSLEPDEDIIKDLLGYWILLQVIRRKAARAAQ